MKGKARVTKVTRRNPTETSSFHVKANSSNDLSEQANNMRERLASMSNKLQSMNQRSFQNTEEVSRPTLEEDTAFFAGT